MSLRTTSRQATGLPSTPRARTFSRPDAISSKPIVRSQSPSAPAPSSRSLRAQRSFTNVPPHSQSKSASSTRDWIPDVPVPSRPRVQTVQPKEVPRSRARSQSRHRPAQDASSPVSDASSTPSFMFDRSTGHSGTSSRTSWDDETPAKAVDGPVWLRDKPDSYRLSSEPNEMNPASGGYTLWSRVAEAASSLTISVGQAWTSNVAVYSGEVTPPGEESHLTRAMKAYHLEKARSPSELPDWLFSDRERGVRSGSSRRATSSDEPRRDREYESEDRPMPPPLSRGLRDVYAAAASSARSEPDLGRRGQTVDRVPSKATDRLKAMRDEKRSAVQARRAESVSSEPTYPTTVENAGSQYQSRPRVSQESQEARRPAPPPARMGLPSRPGARRV